MQLTDLQSVHQNPLRVLALLSEWQNLTITQPKKLVHKSDVFSSFNFSFSNISLGGGHPMLTHNLLMFTPSQSKHTSLPKPLFVLFSCLAELWQPMAASNSLAAWDDPLNNFIVTGTWYSYLFIYDWSFLLWCCMLMGMLPSRFHVLLLFVGIYFNFLTCTRAGAWFSAARCWCSLLAFSVFPRPTP